MDDIKEDNQIVEILKSGFSFSQDQGQIFSTGMIKLKHEMEKQVNSPSDQSNTFELMLCEITPGNAYVHKIKEDDEDIVNKLKMSDLPEGFDSYLLQYEKEGEQQQQGLLGEEEELEEEEEPYQSYVYNYVLFKPTQVQRKYVMTVEISAGGKENLKCHLCSQDAVFYCVNDKVPFCDSCNQAEHQYSNKTDDKTGNKRIKHEVRSLSESGPPLKLPECSQHQGNLTDLFCPICQEALCVLCVIGNEGKNSQNQKSSKHQNHPICQLKQVYEEARMDSKDINQAIEGRNSVLKKELDKINGDLVEVHKNSKQVIEEIYKKHLTALEKLQKVTDGKIHKLQSMQMEVQRQINQLQYGEDFLKIQMRQLEPIEYL